MRTIYWAWSTVLFAAIVVQVGLAGYGAFYAANKLEDEGSTIDEDVFFDGFVAHALFGYIVILAGLVFLLVGLVAGVGKWRLGRHGVLFGLLILQMLLAWFGFGVPAIGFLHPVNALLLFLLAGWVAWDEWRLRRTAPTAAAAA
ncbi:MAG: hypothetical protein ACRDNY_12495 [Gaiellaceae bacterium]